MNTKLIDKTKEILELVRINDLTIHKAAIKILNVYSGARYKELHDFDGTNKLIRKEDAIKNILAIVNETYPYRDITIEEICSNKRDREIIYVRRYFYFSIKYHLEWTLKEIGREFNRDHSSIVNSLQKLDNELHYKEEVKRELFITKNVKAYLRGEEMDNKFVL
tara:strand:- start:755 stop:1246 length:492 start_codon:yes stop_codon:yes gene_type:complete